MNQNSYICLNFKVPTMKNNPNLYQTSIKLTSNWIIPTLIKKAIGNKRPNAMEKTLNKNFHSTKRRPQNKISSTLLPIWMTIRPKAEAAVNQNAKTIFTTETPSRSNLNAKSPLLVAMQTTPTYLEPITKEYLKSDNVMKNNLNCNNKKNIQIGDNDY